MSGEYQRLEAEASEVQQQIQRLVDSCVQMAPVDFQKFEAEMGRLHLKLAGLREGLGLLKLVGSRKMQDQAAKFARSQSKPFHSQGLRTKKVQLRGGVTVTLNITYYHRCMCPDKAKKKGRTYSSLWEIDGG